MMPTLRRALWSDSAATITVSCSSRGQRIASVVVDSRRASCPEELGRMSSLRRSDCHRLLCRPIIGLGLYVLLARRVDDDELTAVNYGTADFGQPTLLSTRHE